MLCIPKREADPTSAYWKPLSCAKYLDAKIKDFTSPAALICYWRTQKVRGRVIALPDKWQAVLHARYQARLDALNDTGPYPAYYER